MRLISLSISHYKNLRNFPLGFDSKETQISWEADRSGRNSALPDIQGTWRNGPVLGLDGHLPRPAVGLLMVHNGSLNLVR